MTNSTSVPKVLAVVVTFHPDGHALERLLQALSGQVAGILIVDNTPASDASTAGLLARMQGLPGLCLHALGHNTGIAAAQNIGIEQALAEGFDYVLLSDQDSLPDADMVAQLLDCCEQLQARGVAVGCICPEYFDETTGQRFRFQVQLPGELFYSSVRGERAEPWIEIITTISSGTLLPRLALETVGGMREDFFIDHVDTEWCHRARASGLHNFGTARARLTHSLGDEPFRVWYFGWRRHSEYSPTRLYYRFRNFVLLCRLPHVPRAWVVRASWYWLGNAYAHALFARRRAANARAIALGLWDGLAGRRGPAGRSF